MTFNEKQVDAEHVDRIVEGIELDPANAAEQTWGPVDAALLAREKRLVRKLDCTLMPTIWVLYLFNYLDRNNIAQAKLDNFESDLGLKGTDFNTAVSILNVGYMLMQLPSNMLLTKVRPSLYIPFWVCVWSCVSAATAGVHSYQGLIAVRFFLGLAEAPFFPGVFYLLSCWYTKKELALRTAILYSGLVLATAFSGLIAAGVFAGLDGTHGLRGWQWLFIITGAASFFFGIAAVFFLPDYPGAATGSSKWLFTEDELSLAKQRILRQQVSNQESDHSMWHGLKLAATDFRVWVFALILCSNHTAYGFNNFYPSIVEGFGLGSRTITLVCTAPPYLIAAAISFAVAFSSDHHRERGWHIIVPMATAAVGFAISVGTLHVGARYFASFLFISGCFAASSLVYTWAASAVSQTPQKRACATAIINVTGQLGNIWSPYFFRPQDSPRYVLAMILMMTFSGISILGCFLMKTVLRRDNKKILARYEGTEQTPVLHVL